MPESARHARLVQAIVAHAERRLGKVADILVRDDAVRPLRGERPPKLAGFMPDVYATDVPTTKTLVGEAKTRTDLETQHSRAQISAFLEYLAYTPGGLFVLAVPVGDQTKGKMGPERTWATTWRGCMPQTEVIDDTEIGTD